MYLAKNLLNLLSLRQLNYKFLVPLYYHTNTLQSNPISYDIITMSFIINIFYMTNNKAVLTETTKNWLPLAVTIVIFTGLILVAVQQNYRNSANDPQIQIAEDVATAINNGSAAPDAIVSPTPTTDMAASLSSFVTIYSATGTPIGSSVSLDGKLPTLPSGIFDNVKTHGQDRFTWEPQKDLRIATVVTKYTTGSDSGFVLAGRSLRDIETRESQLSLMSLIAGLAALILSFGLSWWNTKKLPHHQHHKEEEPKVA